MSTVAAGDLLAMLARIPDPRGRQGRRFGLSAMLATVVCGILTGARGYTAIAGWIHRQEVQVWHWLGFTRKPPCPNAFRDLLMALDAGALETVLREWAEQLLGETLPPELQVVSIDGKTLCSTLTAHGRSVHLLSVLDQRTGFVLSQQEVDSKTNEHKGALQLLKTLVLKGRLARISHCAKKRTAFLSHKLLVNGNFGKNKEAVRWLQSVANDRSISSPWRRGR